jgi:quercetin dioxygenase-like cupin family protein
MNFGKIRPIVRIVAGLAGSLAIAAGQPIPTNTILTNLDTAKWTHDKGDPPGTEAVRLREDPKTGGMELLVRFPPGHVIKPHYHDSNERIIVLEGRLSVRRDDAVTALDPGGFAFLPAGQVQRLSCSSKTRCTFYLAWDGKPDSHPAK